DPADAENQRRFVFTSEHMQHRINGRTFRMDRIDQRVPFGRTEIWTFVNDSFLPHPVHLHATHFRVLERTGGRGRVLPWEAGLKDTSVIYPGETVRVAVRFSAQRGLFLLHCHNLTHEDRGMMQNILVEG
ncbi:MAG: multicopper oxidase domain-containing protein, partial [Longimicrobiales bacterium]|nr:multicopper oxidase domain-containing protein [Longimicrobiales bacterium]